MEIVFNPPVAVVNGEAVRMDINAPGHGPLTLTAGVPQEVGDALAAVAIAAGAPHVQKFTPAKASKKEV